jgi:hypothetical protein
LIQKNLLAINTILPGTQKIFKLQLRVDFTEVLMLVSGEF